jgi:hypothetical protein
MMKKKRNKKKKKKKKMESSGMRACASLLWRLQRCICMRRVHQRHRRCRRRNCVMAVGTMRIAAAMAF